MPKTKKSPDKKPVIRRSFITVRSEFEGFHKWPDAPEAVSFLRELHRHLFKVSVSLLVGHSDRELEFFLVQADLKIVVDILKGYLVVTPSLSCEAMAENIFAQMKAIGYDTVFRVTVSEDGENEATFEELYQ